MSILGHLRSLYFSYLSDPRADRPIYRAIRHHHVRKIVELGIGDGQRATRMIAVAGTAVPAGDVCYTGIDPFEAQSNGQQPCLTLKAAFRTLRQTGAQIRLLPGDLLDTLAQNANRLGQVDLLILTHQWEPQRLARAWLFIPRLLHQRSLVYLEKRSADGELLLQLIPHQEIKAMEAAAMRRRAA